jgi:uncharacterized membrane protein
MNMKINKKYVVLFTVGGAGYAIIELLWRGRTHWTMIMAGGICFIIFSLVEERLSAQPLIYKSVICALGVTVLELIFGVIFNVILKMNVWDYSSMPFNFLGQICPTYTLLWVGLSALVLPIIPKVLKLLTKDTHT